MIADSTSADVSPRPTSSINAASAVPNDVGACDSNCRNVSSVRSHQVREPSGARSSRSGSTSGKIAAANPTSINNCAASLARATPSMPRISCAIRSGLTTVTCAAAACNRRSRRRFEFEAEYGRHPHGPHHAELVFVETSRGVADGADDAALDVVAPADVVDHAILRRVEEQRVHREVAASGVFFGVGKLDRVGPTTVAILGIAAKGRHFDVARLLRRRCTAITPNASPIANVRRSPNSARTCSGRAFVATS